MMEDEIGVLILREKVFDHGWEETDPEGRQTSCTIM